MPGILLIFVDILILMGIMSLTGHFPLGPRDILSIDSNIHNIILKALIDNYYVPGTELESGGSTMSKTEWDLF